MPTFTPAGDVPTGYAGMFSNLVRGPNGTIVQAPQFGAPTSVDEIYRGIIPSAASPSDPIGPGLDWNSLIGLVEDPIYRGDPGPYTPQNTTYGEPPTSVAQTRSEQVRPRVVPTIPVAGSAGGAQALRAIADLVGIPQPNGSIDANKSDARVPLISSPLLAFDGDQNTGMYYTKGGGVPLPRVRPNPTANVPLPRIRPILPTDTSGGVKITVPYSSGSAGNGGGAASDGSYVVQRGDTLSAISRKSGVPVAVLAATNGIRDPNKIYVGQKLNFGSMTAPSNSAVRPLPAPTFPRTAMAPDNFLSGDPGTVDWSIANQGMQGLGGPLNATTLAAAFAPQRDTGQSGGGTIYTNPTKYGATQEDRNAAAAQRAAFLAQWGG